MPPATEVDNKSTMCRYTGTRELDAFKSYVLEKQWDVNACEQIPVPGSGADGSPKGEETHQEL